MADGSSIEWTDATWNPVVGCSVVSPGCTHCYAMKLAGGRLRNHPSRAGLTQPSKAGPVWTGKVRLWEPWLTQPFEWKTPRRIFVCAHGDLFHEDVPDEWIDKVFAVMALTPQHTYQVLTKRAKRMREYFAERWQGTPAQRFKVGDTVIDMPAGGETGREHQVESAVEEVLEGFPKMRDSDDGELWTEAGDLKIRQYKWPLPNVWLGVSAEDQARADERIPHLLATPAAKRFISAEPLLGAINIIDAMWAGEDDPIETLNAGIDWVIAGGESGPGARPSHPDWFRSLRDQCAAAGVPFFFKQWGTWGPSSEQAWIDDDGSNRHMLVAPDGRHGDTIADMITAPKGTAWMRRLGKKRAGAVLDGKLHREFPT